MKYKDQLVHTGMVNDSSDALNVNVPDSYRRGIELTASWRVTGWFTAGANATFSQNRIENYVDALSNSPTYGQNLGERTISYSPSAMGSLFLDFHYRGFEAVLHTQAVGKQYFTNDENETLSPRPLLRHQPQSGLHVPHPRRPKRAAGPADQQPLQRRVRKQRLRLFVHGHVERPDAPAHRHGLLLRAGAPERAGQRHGKVLTGKFRPPGTRSGGTQRR